MCLTTETSGLFCLRSHTSCFSLGRTAARVFVLLDWYRALSNLYGHGSVKNYISSRGADRISLFRQAVSPASHRVSVSCELSSIQLKHPTAKNYIIIWDVLKVYITLFYKPLNATFYHLNFRKQANSTVTTWVMTKKPKCFIRIFNMVPWKTICPLPDVDFAYSNHYNIIQR